MFQIGFSAKEYVESREVISYRGVFDLGGKFAPPIEEETIYLPLLPGINRTYANRIAEMWDDAAKNHTPVLIHNSLHVAYENRRANAADGKVMLFGDSFVDFRPTTLASMFVEHFRETHIVWSNNIDEEYIRAIKPDFLITENAERFMRSVPAKDYSVEVDAAKRIVNLG